PTLNYASIAVRRGLSSAEMAAYAAQNEEDVLSRRKLHRGFLKIKSYLGNGRVGETLNELDLRVKNAIFQNHTK
ncbi:MAG: hypothetical protein RR721_07270, partial [Aeromonas sp.]